MSKLYQLNRMRGSAAAGDLWGSLLKLGGKAVKGIGKLFSKKTKTVIAEQVLPAAKKVIPYALPAVGVEVAQALMNGGGKQSAGATGGWGTRRRRGITATELRGFHKVARLLHKEGMVVKHARRG